MKGKGNQFLTLIHNVYCNCLFISYLLLTGEAVERVTKASASTVPYGAVTTVCAIRVRRR